VTLVTGSDGLPVRVVQPWAKDKLDYLSKYIDIFTTSMKDKWTRRVYVDLFSGPGRSLVDGTDEEIDGSPLIAAAAKNPFTGLYFNDIDPQATDALTQRFGLTPAAPTTIRTLDCNDAAADAASTLFAARGTLGLAFIDPTAFQVGFDAVRTLTTGRPIDVIVTVMTSYMKRFLDHPSFSNPLDEYFGSSDWQSLIQAKNAGEQVTSRALLNHYEERLRTLGYRYFNDEARIVNSKEATIYHLVFASKDPLAEKFFKAVTRRNRSGQARLDL
jgi:three-Cys-motif partner protein